MSMRRLFERRSMLQICDVLRGVSGVTLACALGLAADGCGAGSAGVDYGRYDSTTRVTVGPALQVRWAKPLAPEFGGAFVPVERAGVAIDAARERLFIGSSERELWAIERTGEVLWKRKFDAGIDAEPTLDARRDELYVTTASGHVYGMSASDGTSRFDVDLGASISQPGVLSDDALYLVTDADGVFALSRKDGSTLWRYQREPRAGLKITGHAGLLSSDQRLITGFSDGTIVSLAKGDGRVLWTVDTTLDLEDSSQAEIGFVDVDTTPVQVGDTVYAASFLAGLYALNIQDGVTALRNAELTGVTSIAGDERTITIVSSEHGVRCYDLPGLAPRWTREEGFRGAPNNVRLKNRTLFVTESRGALLALSIADGREVGRLQTVHGFAAAPSMSEGQGAILGNAGTLYAFDY
jgi:outer membrane protein assembly factor BamB